MTMSPTGVSGIAIVSGAWITDLSRCRCVRRSNKYAPPSWNRSTSAIVVENKKSLLVTAQ